MIPAMQTPAMETRKLGRTAVEVSALGLGCISLSGVYGAADDAASVALIQHALDRGITHLDSSDMYGWGQNEEVIARAVRGRRAGVAIGCAFGQPRTPGARGDGVNAGADSDE